MCVESGLNVKPQTYRVLCLSANINSNIFLFLLPSISIHSSFCVIHLYPPLSTPISPSADLCQLELWLCRSCSVWQEIEEYRKWGEITFDEIGRHYPTMINRRQRRQRHFQNVILELSSWPQTIILFPLHLNASMLFFLSPLKSKTVAPLKRLLWPFSLTLLYNAMALGKSKCHEKNIFCHSDMLRIILQVS